jgi:hypothetical protein
MASDGNPGSILITSLVQGIQGPAAIHTQQAGGKAVPPVGKNVAQPAPAGSEGSGNPVAGSKADSPAAPTAATAPRKTDPQSLVDLLNKYLNDSGRPDQYRVAPASGDTLIQQINPATGAVIGEFSVTEFPALARSVGATGLLVDSRA